MDKRLSRLVNDYQASVRLAVEMMHRSGIPLPSTCTDWVATDIPQQGKLAGDIRYFKHGFGCSIHLPAGAVDFDFGESGEIDGFDVGRLFGFAGTRLRSYGFETRDALAECFKTAVAAGSLVHSGYVLYYVAAKARTLAIDLRR